MTGRYPVAVLLINVAPEDVDVNVHPTKAEVRFRDGDAVFSAVQRAVRRAVIEQAQTPTLRGRLANGNAEHVWNPGSDPVQMGMNLRLQDIGQPAIRQHADASYEDTDFHEGPHGPARPRTLPMLRVIGQVGASYIVAEGPAGLYLIDQHAAHERILYEQFMAEHAQKESISQYTLAAQTIQVAPPEARLLEENLPTLHALGFAIEPFGPNVFVIRSVPAILADGDPIETMAVIIDDLVQGNKPGQEAVEDRIVLHVCKQAAIKAGQVLALEQMQGLIRQLERCQSPLTCPHGRPTMIHMSSDQLAREFGRL
jgi:DNA mismatch repair protein MutL